METCFNYCYERNKKDNVAWFSSDEQKWINKIRKLKNEYPDEIQIIAEPETNDGCIYCQLPASWLKIQPKRKTRTMTEEERIEAVERLKQARQIKSSSKLL